MFISLDFDILFILILIAFLAIGYITGATIELIKLVRIYVPFIVVFFIGGPLSRWVYKLLLLNNVIGKINVLRAIPYFNTFIMLLATIIAFFGAYFIIGLIIRFIKNRLQSEIVTYKLGKFNNQLGAVIAVGRFYIIVSLLVLPFFMLGFTTTKDFSTNLVLKYPPPFTQVGRLVHSAQPVLTASNSLSTFIEVVDVNKLKEYYRTVSDLPTTLNNYETKVQEKCDYSIKSGKYPFLTAYVNNPTLCTDEELTGILPYKGFIIWISEDNVDISNLTDEALITEFNDNYREIHDNTDDKAMKEKIIKAHEAADVYVIVDNWLNGIIEEGSILNDDNMEQVINQLVVDRANKDSEGLFFELGKLNRDEIDQKLKSLETFTYNYTEIYKPVMDKMSSQLPFKYKLIASTLKNVNFMPSLVRTPLMAMYIIDTIELLAEGNIMLMNNESIYRTLVKIMIPLYILTDKEGNSKVLTEEGMKEILTKKCANTVCSIDDAFDKVIITEDFFIELMYALTEPQGEEHSYLEELVNDNMIESKAVDVLEAYFNDKFKEENEKTIKIREALSKVGEANG